MKIIPRDYKRVMEAEAKRRAAEGVSDLVAVVNG